MYMRGAGVARLMRVGGDLFLRTGAVLVFLALCTRVANLFGPDQGAAFQAIRQFFIFSALFLDAFAITGQSLVGYFLGADDTGKARDVARLVCWWSFGTGVALCAAMLLGTDLVAWLLVPPAAYAVFVPGWIVVSLSQPIGSLSFATDGIHWGTGDFAYLRNSMLAASAVGGACVLAVEFFKPSQVLGLHLAGLGRVDLHPGRIRPGSHLARRGQRAAQGVGTGHRARKKARRQCRRALTGRLLQAGSVFGQIIEHEFVGVAHLLFEAVHERQGLVQVARLAGVFQLQATLAHPLHADGRGPALEGVGQMAQLLHVA